MPDLTIYSVGIGACVFALLTITSRDIFHSAVWLALSLMSIAGIYFYLNAEFLGVIQVLVYIGGIITLFVFAIKLTAKIGDVTIKQSNQQVFISGLATVVVLYILLKIVRSNPWAPLVPAEPVTLKQLGNSLLTTYVLPFEFISLLLLGVMVGAIIIGKVKK